MLPLAVSWKASGQSARGFYHPEEERLVVCRRDAAPFSSYVDAGCVQIDLDSDGTFIGLAVDSARERWPVEGDLWAPRVAIPATVQFRSSAVTLGGAHLATDPDRLWLRIDLEPVSVISETKDGPDGNILPSPPWSRSTLTTLPVALPSDSHVLEPCENVLFEVSASKLFRIWVLSIQEDTVAVDFAPGAAEELDDVFRARS